MAKRTPRSEPARVSRSQAKTINPGQGLRLDSASRIFLTFTYNPPTEVSGKSGADRPSAYQMVFQQHRLLRRGP